LVAVLNGSASGHIDGRSPEAEKNTFRIGPEPEENDSIDNSD